ncbi:MAG: 16S rRNA (adenine(1518)-N(6)/adenine(1519)-N(6))-dimethyltransferase RsmA [Treponemataceae bacterium]|nr:16S rRNA (adenine(1518)-N(6)/adenine(1519)-N(6))-dimethyltransferase RsmA [Treponemataceae bacterium]
MSFLDYNSPIALKELLEAKNMAMQKKFGQNFLVNPKAREQLANALDITEGATVWEIGPGLGAMTIEILKRGAHLTVFEIDRGFIAVLKHIFAPYVESGRLKIVEGDVLKTWKTIAQDEGIPHRFFGNLPYNIAASLLADTIENEVRFEKAVITVQREVALRAMAQPNTQDFSSFSVLCQWAYTLKTVMDLAGGNFWPRPNVDSRAILLTARDDFPQCKNPKHFLKLQRALFLNRRKTIKNNLSAFLSNTDDALAALKSAEIAPEARAESLPIEKMLQLSDILSLR